MDWPGGQKGSLYSVSNPAFAPIMLEVHLSCSLLGSSKKLIRWRERNPSCLKQIQKLLLFGRRRKGGPGDKNKGEKIIPNFSGSKKKEGEGLFLYTRIHKLWIQLQLSTLLYLPLEIILPV